MAGYVVLDEIVSESSGQKYEIRRGGDGILYCQCASTGRVCQGWLGTKNRLRKGRQEHLPAECKHTKAYVSKTGASYGPMYETKVSGVFKAGKVPKFNVSSKSPAKSSVPVLATKPAPKNWKEVLLAEQAAAEARGVHTPAAMLAEFKSEIGRFANLDVDLGEEDRVDSIPVAAARALDVDME